MVCWLSKYFPCPSRLAVNSKYVLGYCSLALIQSSVLGKISISYQKDDLKDLFNWNKYGVFDHYGVIQASNIMEIENIFSE